MSLVAWAVIGILAGGLARRVVGAYAGSYCPLG